MTVFRPRLRTSFLAVAVLLALAAPAAQAQTGSDQASFDLVIKGITAGSLSFSGTQNGNGYAVSGRLQTSGLAALLVPGQAQRT